VGYWQDGERNGKGTYEYANGDVYDGECCLLKNKF
jgi:hypothetical protein